MIILGLETSCDETACAILEQKDSALNVLSSIVSSQIEIHSKWGGVVPNLAAREHLKNILPIIKKGLKTAKIKMKEVDLISVTNGPGLIPALLIGVQTAKTLSYLWKKPLLGIHHIEGHIYANFIKEDPNKKIKFPVLCLVVSGGHTQLVLMKKHLEYKIIGETLDDAAGEAFDKVARILGLSYPGGPIISKLAEKFVGQKSLVKNELKLPRPMINSKNLSFSFSGLKTAVLYLSKKNESQLKNQEFVQFLCYEFQQAVIDVLISKTIQAAKIHKPKTIMLAGGVSANLELRKQLGENIKNNFKNIQYSLPNLEYSIDNATMIAMAGLFHWKENEKKPNFQKKIKENWKNLKTEANLKLI